MGFSIKGTPEKIAETSTIQANLKTPENAQPLEAPKPTETANGQPSTVSE